MKKQAKFQMIGPVVVFIAVLAAELAAAALARWPSSELLWRANIEWFHAFQKSSYALSAFGTVSYLQLWLIAFPLIAMALGGIALRRPLLLAVASNLSLVYASFVLYADYLYDQGGRVASVSLVTPSANPDVVLCIILVAASFVGFADSHLYYIRAVRDAVR
ncbi:MAG: hypothetical protein JWO19_6018 [Bryobacterales bacterium]|nr:hypothetical protein [Bryobacterales bacterium]